MYILNEICWEIIIYGVGMRVSSVFFLSVLTNGKGIKGRLKGFLM